MNKKAKGILVITIVGIIGMTTLAFADWGHRYGPMRGPGMHRMGGYGYGQGGYSGNLSAEEIAKLDEQRAEFFKATENIRQKLYEKELALQGELAKEEPDTSKASKLQNEISELQGTLDQKRLDYELKLRKSSPNSYRSYRGYGRMMGNGPMMGYGGRGGGYCRW